MIHLSATGVRTPSNCAQGLYVATKKTRSAGFQVEIN